MSNLNIRKATLGIEKATALRPWIVWGLACVFYFYEFLLQVSPSVMSSELMRDFGVTSQTLGVLSGAYYYSYAFMQLPGGVMMDYFGPRRLLTIATAICAISTIAFGLTDSFAMAYIARLMIGFGSAFAAVGAMKFASSWFKPEKFALLTGLMVTIGMLGAIGGEAPLALLIDKCGWRESMEIMGVAGIIIAILIFTITTDKPKSVTEKPKKTKQSSNANIFSDLIVLLKNRKLWLVATYGGLMYMATPVFCGLWGVPFMMMKMGLPKAVAANYISLVFVGWAVAGPLWGIYSNRIGLRKQSMYIGCIGAILTSCAFIFANIQSPLMMQILLFLFGVSSAGFLTAFSIAKELCNKDCVATGLSFMNMMNMLGIALAQPAIGFILDRMWQGEILDKVRVYPLEAYYYALALLPIGMVIALILLPRVPETYCKSIAK
ncbi:MAG: MFS transporter [Legionellaceae bacterium]|nr:MFS transporter [Legionellaceae bacterium]